MALTFIALLVSGHLRTLREADEIEMAGKAYLDAYLSLNRISLRLDVCIPSLFWYVRRNQLRWVLVPKWHVTCLLTLATLLH